MNFDIIEWASTALPLRLMVTQARTAGLDRNCDVEMVFLLPDDRLPGVTELEGVPVVRHVGEPMLAFRQAKPLTARVDSSCRTGVVEFRDGRGRVVSRIENVGGW